MSWNNMEKLDKYLDENNMAEIDWNALNSDAEGKKKNAQRVITTNYKNIYWKRYSSLINA